MITFDLSQNHTRPAIMTNEQILERYSMRQHGPGPILRAMTSIASKLIGNNLKISVLDPGTAPSPSVVKAIVDGYKRTGIGMNVDESNAVLDESVTVVIDANNSIVTYQVVPKEIEEIPAINLFSSWNGLSIRDTARSYITPNADSRNGENIFKTVYVTRFSTDLAPTEVNPSRTSSTFRKLTIAGAISRSKPKAMSHKAIQGANAAFLITTKSRAEMFAKGLDEELIKMPNSFDRRHFPMTGFMTDDFLKNGKIKGKPEKIEELNLHREVARVSFEEFKTQLLLTNPRLLINGSIDDQDTILQCKFVEYLCSMEKTLATANYILDHLRVADDRAHIYIIPLKK